MFVRYQARVPNHRGIHIGVFGLANGLALEGKLSDTERAAWRAGNDWFNLPYPDPSKLNPGVYDPQVNPQAAAWFKDTAKHLLERIEPCLEMLMRHDMTCRLRDSSVMTPARSSTKMRCRLWSFHAKPRTDCQIP